MNIKTGERRVNYISLAGVVSAIAVIFLHTNGCFWAFSATERYWRTANLIENVCYFTVPVFFMISGSTLFHFYERYGLGTYFKKRAAKTLLPYLFWSFVGLIFQIFYMGRISAGEVDVVYVIKMLLNGQGTTIYWFFIPLFVIYLSIPLFAAVAEERRRQVFTYLAGICFLCNALIPFINSVFHLDFAWYIQIDVGAGYLLLVLIGYLLHRYTLPAWGRAIVYCLGLAGLLMMIVGTRNLSMEAGYVVETYKGYTNVPCVLYASAVFLFFKHAGSRLLKLKAVAAATAFLSKFTFSLYLVHWFFMQMIIRELNPNVTSLRYRLGAPFLILAASIAFVWLIRKIPFAKYIIPE